MYTGRSKASTFANLPILPGASPRRDKKGRRGERGRACEGHVRCQGTSNSGDCFLNPDYWPHLPHTSFHLHSNLERQVFLIICRIQMRKREAQKSEGFNQATQQQGWT